MSTTGIQPMPGDWEWPENTVRPRHQPEPESTGANTSRGTQSSQGPSMEQPHPRQRRHWPPRTCRICLETVHPTFSEPSEHLPGIFQSAPTATYQSEEGRLLRPCKCKGSSKYVHDGCLQAWRLADPMNKRNYWQCPTCGFRYRLERMNWARYISSTATQISLTVFILVVAMFLLGFVADPIINIYLDPYGSLSPFSFSRSRPPVVMPEEDPVGWFEHFLKGFASLGLLSFVKMIFASPLQWFNLRHYSFGGSTRATASGRDRLQNISWLVVLIGVVTFLYAVWRGVRAWSRRTLEAASERVVDVHGDDGDDDDD